MNKTCKHDELRARNRWGAQFDFSTKTAPIYILNVQKLVLSNRLQ